MNRFVLFLFLAACTSAAFAQTPAAKPATPAKPATAAKPASSTANPGTTKPASAAASAPEPQPWIKLPAGVPRVTHALVKMPFALRYEDVKVGTGALGESGKMWHLKYTGWRAADGIKFDSWDDHKQPAMGPDGKPKMGADGKPVMGDPVPIAIPQGMGRVIPGFDFGLDGMKIGGKRRIFIPWQMAYGTHAIPDRPDHPGIPAKSDLIFDVELVDVTDMPQPHPPMMPGNRPMPPNPGAGSPPSVPPSAPAVPSSQPAAPTGSAPPAAPTGSAPSGGTGAAATAPPAAPPATAQQPTAPAQPTPGQAAPPPPPSGVQAQPQPK
jgi:peptidylprolyl isomerase